MDIGDAGFAAGALALAMAVVRIAEKSIMAALAKRKDSAAKSCPDHTAILEKIAEHQARGAEVMERMFEKQITMDTKFDVAIRDIAVIRERRESA